MVKYLEEKEEGPFEVNSAILNSLAYSLLEFNDKAIWTCKLQNHNNTLEEIRNKLNFWTAPNTEAPNTEDQPIPPLEHMAFVARASLKGKYVYFIAQFGRESYIPTEEEKKTDEHNKFHAIMKERNLHDAAVSVLSDEQQTDVWVKTPILDDGGNITGMVDGPKILSHPDAKLVADEHDSSLWTEMSRPLSLDELDGLMSKTDNAGKKYAAWTNNCQTFAKSMYKLA